MRAKGTLHGKDGKNLAVGNMAKVMCWQFCVCIYLSHFYNIFFFFYPCSFNFREPGRHHLSPASQTLCKTEWGRCWWHHCGGCKVMMEWWPVCVRLCVQSSGSRACQRATVSPLLLHHSQFTTKHPHRSVWGYLWGDCKMSMDFRPHCTDLKTHSGTFRTANGFQRYMTSALSCFFFFLHYFSFDYVCCPPGEVFFFVRVNNNEDV